MFFKSRKTQSPASATPDPATASHPTTPANGAAGSAGLAPTATARAAVASPSRPAGSQGTQEQANARTGRLLLVLGQIVAVLMRSAPYKTLPLADLETMVLPAIAAGQFLIANAQAKTGGATVPIAAALWASVSPEVDRRLTESSGQSSVLKAADWKSGDIVWLMLLTGETNSANALFARLQQQGALKGRPIKYMAEVDGKLGVYTLPPPA